tara:strand:- start:1297 stop:1971 length:675 start_codon:yes stop_codon:yes gene_type:complete
MEWIKGNYHNIQKTRHNFYQVRIGYYGENYYLKNFKNLGEAVEARDKVFTELRHKEDLISEGMDWIKGFEGAYKINREGKIWSQAISGRRGNRGQFLEFSDSGNGYLMTYGFVNGRPIKFKPHRLLAIQYIPNPDNKPHVDHINRDRKDNRLENLRWATRLENNNNKGVYKNNKTGHVGIRERCSGWSAEAYYNKKTIKRQHKTLEEAIAWREETIVSMKAGTS